MVITLCGESCRCDSPFTGIYSIIFTSWLPLKPAVGWLLAGVKDRNVAP